MEEWDVFRFTAAVVFGGLLALVGVTILMTVAQEAFNLLFGVPPLSRIARRHFQKVPSEQVVITRRIFSRRVRADLQLGLNRLLCELTTVHYTCTLRDRYGEELPTLSNKLERGFVGLDMMERVAPTYEEIDIGADEPIQALESALWLLTCNDVPLVMLLNSTDKEDAHPGVMIEVGAPPTTEGKAAARSILKALEFAVCDAKAYRGKVLSLEETSDSYTGQSTGIRVHKLRRVTRDQVILPEVTLSLLDRNIITFARQRSQLAAIGQSTKKGILFYGPPGTGKTHTIHYLIRELPNHTAVLVSSDQVDLLSDAIQLARLLQPSIILIEDVDLFARQRETSQFHEQALLQRLLNEMDGLTGDTEVLFVLTTNRPEVLEDALASRPGRVDQAIEFPLPDDAGRRKLVRLYGQTAEIDQDVIIDTARRTQGVSPAFIKELMRRTLQFSLEREDGKTIRREDISLAIEDMLAGGEALNRKLLGANDAEDVSDHDESGLHVSINET